MVEAVKEVRLIKRNAFESGLMRWMNLEPIIHSEENIITNIIY